MNIANLQDMLAAVAPVAPQGDAAAAAIIKRKNARVYSSIMMAMDPRTAEHLENHVTEDSGTEAWKTLNDFDAKGRVHHWKPSKRAREHKTTRRRRLGGLHQQNRNPNTQNPKKGRSSQHSQT